MEKFIDVVAKYVEDSHEVLPTDYCKIATLPILKIPELTAAKVVEAILYDIKLNHSKLKFIKENGEYKATKRPGTTISYFIKTFEEDLDFAKEVWHYTIIFLP